MDARLRFTDQVPPVFGPLEVSPPESPLKMPEQPVSAEPAAAASEPDWRLGCILLGAGVLVAVAGSQLYGLLARDGMSLLEWIPLSLFMINLLWVSAAGGTALAGAIVLLRAKPAASAGGAFASSSRTAIIFPMYNEDPAQVMGAADAVFRSLCEAGAAHGFDVFFLSDTRDARIAATEEETFSRLRLSRPGAPFYYRRRFANTGRKAGNVEDFVRRWGGRYDYMAVFDADSLMSADALVELVRRMDARPGTGLIQSLPVIVNARTVYGRTQQFAMRAYGAIFGAGLAWWSGGAGNFWGHNAIIRVTAFAASAGLPRLPGRAPFGGPILSHDFVEAALMRRAGWKVEIAHDIVGSYEESPPTLVDAIARDRRWAQGNLQHIPLIRARGFHWLNRAHITAGVMGYLSAALWFALVASSILLAPAGADTAPDSWSSSVIHLSALTAVVLLSPKWLAVILWACGRLPGWRRRSMFLPSLAFETVISTVIAPIQMVSQTLAIASTVLGKDFGWAPQVRNRASGFDHRELVRCFAPQMALGAILLALMLGSGSAAAAWWAPLAVALLLSPAICHVLSDRVRPTDHVWRATEVPEDVERPAIVAMAEASTRWLRDSQSGELKPTGGWVRTPGTHVWPIGGEALAPVMVSPQGAAAG